MTHDPVTPHSRITFILPEAIDITPKTSLLVYGHNAWWNLAVTFENDSGIWSQDYRYLKYE